MDCKRSKIGVALAMVFGIFLSCGTCFVAQAGAQDGSNSSKSPSVTDQIERATDKVNKTKSIKSSTSSRKVKRSAGTLSMW